ncbi:SMP-30/gluconolactonase/LRE family protein [Mesorhizobium sp. 8]|uniref:SMP-30/gluconolactonase/LRE family protein n=1 Tax=Mesorhizobium sp. 8 TaxID=2584466 RepID=UPI0011226E50|nr:SMP-30/gluconolactonase/LRE family protein [Mesorhizobium sp. 8]QDC01859.1 SMP-30/gluconolactonase/LRE family protein [Mesorhizobium sp. 8]
MSEPAVTALSDTVCELGEGPSYDPTSGSLYWFDIVNGLLVEHRYDGETKTHPLGRMASAIAIVDGGRQLISAEDGLYLRDVATGKLTLHTPVEVDNHVTRSNDARVHPCGAFWISTMGKKAETGAGSIYWLFKGELRRLFADISIPNSIAFTADGTVAYYTDSKSGLIMRTACDPATGLPIGEAKVFADRGGGSGDHDGSVVDLDGTLWNARWGEACVNAYSPEGKLTRSVRMPTRQPSCPAFYGPDADRLAVTSAWADMDADQRAADPQAGKTFLIDLPVRGRFEPRVLI